MTNTDKIFEMLKLKPEQKFTIGPCYDTYKLTEELIVYKENQAPDKSYLWTKSYIDLNYLIKHSDDIIIIPEKKQYTREQKVIAEALALQGFNWLTKDKDGNRSLYASVKQPKKGTYIWELCGAIRRINFDFPQITWEDDEPVWIKDIIDNTKQNDWIYVKDRVPSEDEWLDKERDCYKNLLFCYDQGDRYMIGCYDGYKWMNDIGNKVLTDVVAWKPFENLKKNKIINKKKFNIKNYSGYYVMHCNTEEKAKIFCKYLDSIGNFWCNGAGYLQDTKWNMYEDKTCYNFNKDSYAEMSWYKERGYTVLEFDNFDWNGENNG